MTYSYERVAVRVFENPHKGQRNTAKKILGLIICSKRLLRWREIQAMFWIDPHTGTSDYEERRLRVTPKDLCGSLVETKSSERDTSPLGEVVELVHSTAKE